MFNSKKRQEKKQKSESAKYISELIVHLSYLECYEAKIHFDKNITRVEIFGEVDGCHARMCEGVSTNFDLLEAIKDAFAIVRSQTGIDLASPVRKAT